MKSAIVLLIITAINQGSGLKCHKCRMSISGDGCDDPLNKVLFPEEACSERNFTNALTKEVEIRSPGDNFTCFKVEYRSKDGIYRGLQRECSSKEKFCDTLKQVEEFNVEFCGTCDKDGCNSAHNAVVSFEIFLMIVIIFIIGNNSFAV